MSMSPVALRQWISELEAWAYGNSQAPPRERRKHVRCAMKKAEVVYAIWCEGDDPHILCIKGIDTPEGAKALTTAISSRALLTP
jgi:hypothetical protein